MVGVDGSLATNVESMRLVGAVLVEAVLLYVVYGALERAVGPTIRRRLTGKR